MSVVETHEQEMLSGEAVAIDSQPLGVFMRTLGALLDVLISVAIFAVTLYVLFNWTPLAYSSSGVQSIAMITMLVFILVVIPVTIETLSRGRSIGKLAVGGRIVRMDGGAIGFRHAFIRALVGVLETYMTVGAIALLTAIFSARSQRLGDLVAGTYSQRTRTPAVNVAVRMVPSELAGWAEIADVARMPDRLARRVNQFLSHAHTLTPASRFRIATELVNEAAPYVFPLPEGHPELTLMAIAAVRQQREYRGLMVADARAERLARATLGVPDSESFTTTQHAQ
ncbi:RDD family protein [Microbacterium sp. YY-01]|uniref:RDD family protein n=1 Tax=Microbacterium sp. YY-01 TaxID=3421634 RepID=UPI003D1686BD